MAKNRKYRFKAGERVRIMDNPKGSFLRGRAAGKLGTIVSVSKYPYAPEESLTEVRLDDDKPGDDTWPFYINELEEVK